MESFELKAVEHLKIAIENDQKHVPAILSLGEIYRKTGEYKKSQALLDKALTHSKDDYELHYQQAELFYQLKYFDKALSAVNTAIDLKPDEAKLYDLAFSILKENQNSYLAISYLEKLIDLKPLNGEAHYELSKLLTDSNDEQKRKLLLEITIDLKPLFIPAIVDLSLMHLHPNKMEEEEKVQDWNPNIKEAERLLKAAILIDPNLGEPWYLLGELYLKLGSDKEAKEYFHQAYRYQETKGKSAFQLGLSNFTTKSYQNAKSYLSESIKLNFETSTCLYQISKIHEIENENFNEVIKLLHNASNNATMEENIEYDLADKYSKKSNFILARKHLRLALEKKRLHSKILVKIFQITRDQNLPQNEESVLSEAIKLDSSNFMPYYELGLFYLRSNRYDEAKNKFATACENKWDHLESHLELGKLEFKQLNNEQALMHFRIVLDLNNKHKLAKDYLSNIKV